MQNNIYHKAIEHMAFSYYISSQIVNN